MRDLAIWIGIIIVAAVGITLMATKVVPLFEDLRVVEPTNGVQCAIVSRIAHTSIDCWKQDTKPTFFYNGDNDTGFSQTKEGKLVTIAGGLVVKPIYNQYAPDIAGGERQAEIAEEVDSESLFPTIRHNAISVACGKGTIEVDYDTGEATFNNGCNPSEASKELWKAIRPFFDMETRSYKQPEVS